MVPSTKDSHNVSSTGWPWTPRRDCLGVVGDSVYFLIPYRFPEILFDLPAQIFRAAGFHRLNYLLKSEFVNELKLRVEGKVGVWVAWA